MSGWETFARQVALSLAATIVAHWIIRNVPELREYVKDSG